MLKIWSNCLKIIKTLNFISSSDFLPLTPKGEVAGDQPSASWRIGVMLIVKKKIKE